jgi:hypothetical protein
MPSLQCSIARALDASVQAKPSVPGKVPPSPAPPPLPSTVTARGDGGQLTAGPLAAPKTPEPPMGTRMWARPASTKKQWKRRDRQTPAVPGPQGAGVACERTKPGRDWTSDTSTRTRALRRKPNQRGSLTSQFHIPPPERLPSILDDTIIVGNPLRSNTAQPQPRLTDTLDRRLATESRAPETPCPLPSRCITATSKHNAPQPVVWTSV